MTEQGQSGERREPSEEQVTRAARALAGADMGEPDWYDMTEPERDVYREQAETVIAALDSHSEGEGQAFDPADSTTFMEPEPRPSSGALASGSHGERALPDEGLTREEANAVRTLIEVEVGGNLISPKYAALHRAYNKLAALDSKGEG